MSRAHVVNQFAQTQVDRLAGKAQRVLGESIRHFLSGSEEKPQYTRAYPDDGLVGPGSAMWAVHSDVSTLVGGIRALLVQTLHPLVMAGVAEHSDYRNDPLGRLQRTAIFLSDTTFGNSQEADVAIKAVKRIHDHVNGVAPDGRRYSAHDPHLLNWVHCTEVDSFWQSRVRYGLIDMQPGMADRYVAEMSVIAKLLGVENPPMDAAQLQAHLSAFIPELDVTWQTREAVQFIMWPRIPVISRVPYAILLSAAVAMLPDFIQKMLRLRILPLVDTAMVRPSALAVLQTVKWAIGPRPELAAAQAAQAIQVAAERVPQVRA